MPRQQCLNCRFFDEKQGTLDPFKHPPGTGYCRKHPPKAEVHQAFDGQALISVWPRTHTTDWCGDFKPGEQEKEQSEKEPERETEEQSERKVDAHQWPRISDLPEEEREDFRRWLGGQTRPMITDLNGKELPMAEQDGYYIHDYRRWKQGLPVLD